VIAQSQHETAAPAQKLAQDEFYEANKGLIHKFCGQAMRRVAHAGISLDYTDLYQSACEAFLRCYAGYNPELGKFSTYFWRAAQHNINALVGPLAEERLKHGTVSVEEMSSHDGEELSMEEVLLKDITDPESVAAVHEYLAFLDEKLSPLAKLILNWLVEPPEDLMDAFDRQAAHAAFARSIGIARRAATDLSVTSIGDYMVTVHGLNKRDVKRALEEIKQVQTDYAHRFI